MPEIIPFPGKKPEEPKKDITKGEVSKDGRVLSWKSDEPVDPSADMIEYELKKHKRQAEEDSEANGTQKSPEVSLSPRKVFNDKAPEKFPTRQEDIVKKRREERRFKKDFKSNESERYDKVFEQGG